MGGQVMLDEWTVQRGREWCSTNGRSRLVEGRTKERQPTPWVLNSSKEKLFRKKLSQKTQNLFGKIWQVPFSHGNLLQL